MMYLEKLGDKQKRVVEGIFVLHNRYMYEGQRKVKAPCPDVVFRLCSSPMNTKLPEVSDGAAEDQ